MFYRGSKEIGNPNGTHIGFIPRVGEHLELHDGYESKFDIIGEVKTVKYHRFNLNEAPTVYITLK